MSNVQDNSRRKFMGVTGAAGMSVFAAQAVGLNLGMVDIVVAQTGKRAVTPFRFAIISDSHLYTPAGHKFDQQLEDAVDQVNSLATKPDFVLYGGDIAQDGTVEQLSKGKKILSKLNVPVKFIPGEHDWYVDLGAAWKGMYGPDYWSFDHKGVHFIGLNSIVVKDFWTGTGMSGTERQGHMSMLEGPVGGLWGIGDKALEWLKKDVAALSADVPVVVFSHSPLWDYYPRWNFQTVDAPQIRDILAKFVNVQSYHGHVHQTVYNKIGNMSSVGQLSTSWPWPYPAVQLPYPESRQTRSDPSNAADGMGSSLISVDNTFGSVIQHMPFGDSLTPFMKNGYKV